MKARVQKLKYANTSAPLFAMLDVTAACNFRCLHCYNSSGEKAKNELTNDELVDIVKQISEMHPESLCLCGGETMLRSNICDLIKIAKPNVGAVNMVSNGSFMTLENVTALKEAGIDTIQISVDGINEMQHDTFRGYVGAFEKAINAIKIIHSLGIEVLVSFVPNKLNVRTISEFLEMMCELGVSSVRIMPLIPVGRGSKIDTLLLSSDEYADLQLTLDVKKDYFINKGMLIEWGDPLDHMYRLSNNEKIGYKNFQYHVKANGDIAVSAYLPLIVGNVRKHSLKDYWNNGYDTIWYSKEYKKYRDQIESIYDVNTVSEIIENDGGCIDIMHDMI